MQTIKTNFARTELPEKLMATLPTRLTDAIATCGAPQQDCDRNVRR